MNNNCWITKNNVEWVDIVFQAIIICNFDIREANFMTCFEFTRASNGIESNFGALTYEETTRP